MDNETGIETHPFTPFIPQNAKILMLGTFPPKPVRWAMEFYYPNRINDMWRIMGLIFYGDKNTFWNEEKKTFRLDEIKRFLTEKGIAMFDTATRIRRLKDNASDKFLEIVEETDIMKMLAENPTIEAIVTTGEKAASVVAEITSTEIPKVGEFIIFKAT
jgi:G:T/U-mismatch repair DNA glycosylase